MANFWKGADLVNILFVLCLFAIRVRSHFLFEGRKLILIERVPGHRFSFTFFDMLAEMSVRLCYRITDNIKISKTQLSTTFPITLRVFV